MAVVTCTEHFSETELSCRCGKCEFPGMDEEFMDLIEAVRTDPGWKRPMVISSAYRCPEHNNRVSSTGYDGPHTSGKAIDIRVSGKDAWDLMGVASSYEFTGVGVAQKGNHQSRFIHLDLLSDEETKGPRPWIWSY